ncbi:hypothetical protein J5N97_015202 [Dioscorea zingiberensis]|uniref:Uncharacterized protein n=1 Tax=Dioscorea zingiberensis TaxID=325984 RepID=A0A9D5HKG8_9LILI|nr:hypothetical protein J5N97_015202 [Dioscorea zingiberensis]
MVLPCCRTSPLTPFTAMTLTDLDVGCRSILRDILHLAVLPQGPFLLSGISPRCFLFMSPGALPLHRSLSWSKFTNSTLPFPRLNLFPSASAPDLLLVASSHPPSSIPVVPAHCAALVEAKRFGILANWLREYTIETKLKKEMMASHNLKLFSPQK